MDDINRKPPREPKLNLPEVELPIVPLNIREFDERSKERIERVSSELMEGFDFIKNKQKTVTVFGSARFKECNPHYEQAVELSKKVAAEGFAIITGGGPGIMEAANRGAWEHDENEDSYAMCIQLPHEQATNPYVVDSVNFHYFFTRKVMLSFAAEAYVYFPGGYGTLDEFFEIVTLIQTKKIESVPVICIGAHYWNPLKEFLYEHLFLRHAAIDKKDIDLFTITDDIDEVVKLIKDAPIRNE